MPTDKSNKEQIPDGTLIAVDWGTTNFRAYLIGTEGSVLERATASDGLLSISDGNFQSCLQQHCGNWLDRNPKPPVIIAGMVGAKTGWVEAPYIQCPSDTKNLADHLVSVKNDLGADIRIVPGLVYRNQQGVPDIMRGEETVIMGVLAEKPNFQGLVVLPGTHSKHAAIVDGRVVSFRTILSGEIFELLTQRSILKLTTETTTPQEIMKDPAFAEAVHCSAAAPNEILHQLFTVRSRGIVDDKDSVSNTAFLSGLLIGSELGALLGADISAQDPIVVLGSPSLSMLYDQAFRHMGKTSEILDQETALLAGMRSLVGANY